MAFVFWQNVASRHQRDLLRAIAAASGENVVCAVEQGLLPDRIAMGWGDEDFAPVQLVRSDDPATFASLVTRTDDIHVLTGFLYHPVITDAFHELSRSGARIFLHSESVDTGGVKGVMRMARDRIKAAQYRRRVAGVLAIGDMGVRFFRALGFEEGRVVPFGYFVDVASPREKVQGPAGTSHAFRIAYAGQLIRRKGIDILFAALGRLRVMDWTLELFGSGDCESSLKQLAAEMGIESKVSWRGPVAADQVPQSIVGADLLVLPSRWDGWGVVVNEALAAGVPVLCSDRCGARCFLKNSVIGESFPAGDVDALAAILRRRIGAGRTSADTRAACRDAAAALSPEAGARQFLDGIAAIESGAMTPPAPWRRFGAP